MTRLPFYDHIKLSESELEEAILQGKIKKYFYEKNKPYWQEKEGLVSNKSDATTIQAVSNVVQKRSETVRNTSHKAEKH